ADDDRSGAQVLAQLRSRWPQSALPVIVVSGVGDTQLLIELMQQGADDYEVKPVDDLQGFLNKIRRYLQRAAAPAPALEPPVQDLILGRSRIMMNLVKSILQAAQAEGDTLILGETGTGKDLVAKTLHRLSPRARAPFYMIDCTKINDSLFEAELFGYMAGAFSGARQNKKGLIEEADKGIAFLNEIGELPPTQQAKLLTLLENKTITRVGGTTPISLDIVILAATNRDLKNMVEKGRFRKDLYYRLHNHVIVNPPLRDHPEDIPLLADHFRLLFNNRYHKSVETIAADVLACFSRHPWEGNVRELKKVMEQGVKNCLGPLLTMQDLPPREAPAGKTAPAVSMQPGTGGDWEMDYVAFKQKLKTDSAAREKAYLEYHLHKHRHQKIETANAIGIKNYQQLHQIMKRLGLP
ncbi:sigma-54-dependent Fis family transcriptional regulator, partial [candidate division FCPU426 bacterium]|nr:sigma-54-dependent Fis family transcriptional regulator [candidate division FCPU426 bacterium]